MTQPTNGTPRSGRRRGVLELQTEMLHLELIDAEGGILEEEENERRPVDAVDDNHKEEQGAGPPVTQPQLKDSSLLSPWIHTGPRDPPPWIFSPSAKDSGEMDSFGSGLRVFKRLVITSKADRLGLEIVLQ